MFASRRQASVGRLTGLVRQPRIDETAPQASCRVNEGLKREGLDKQLARDAERHCLARL
jgi:hypothetical protein